MRKQATQSSDGTGASDLNKDVRFHAIDGAEPFDRYGPGGYHPVAIGDRLGSRYHILQKLGHGSYSTVWLARDLTLQRRRLVAVKVCTADASPRESEILSHLRSLSEIGDGEGEGDGPSGRGMIPTLLDRFRVQGPHGIHTCLVTDVGRCSVRDAKIRGSYAPLMLPVARAIAAQLILAVAYLHDLHLGNVLLRLPQEHHLWSDDELLMRCGEPEIEPVQTFDDKPIPSDVPPAATLPIWFPMERVNRLPLSAAHVVLTDFGESYRPSQESRSQCRTPVHCRPPESRFEPTKPKSFPSDIWTLACAVWATLAQRPLFETFWSTEDTVTWMQVQTLGKLPEGWWEKWDARSKDFTDEGQPVQADDSPIYTFDYQFEDAIQEGRRRHKMETMGSAEKEALTAMLRPMLAYRPEQRCSVKEILGSEWMTRYAMQDYEGMRSREALRARGAGL
ncbi:Serine/threonine-protein kinase SRPK [Colletotrichum shisoi]|uniref:Serine/threonine-protein kinase SRPK n=1 Tax=Colletotrichum shisoi TaxID=2078593 RepID=A0A5Q4BM11_9PEZI|nr:Serine/threonine-protein kinase SRPK [Colletotrichum shisoi]